MNILFLTHRVPYPPDRGDRIRSFHLLQHFTQQGNVYLASLNDEPAPKATQEALEERCEGVCVRTLGGPERWLRACQTMLAGRSATEGLFVHPAVAKQIKLWTDTIAFDVIVVFCSSMYPYVRHLQPGKTRTVVDLVDVDSQKWMDYAAQSRGWRRRLFQLEGNRVGRLESEILASADSVVVVSPNEAKLLGDDPCEAKVHAIGNGVDLDYFQPSHADIDADTCVFLGALDYRANIDGLNSFCSQVWPRVRHDRPSARLRLVGRNPTQAVRRLAESPGIELVGQVDDVRPHMAAASISVVPLRIARGVQNKVLESMAMGKAVIASPESLVGIDVEPGIHVRAAETPDEWAAAIERLLNRPDEARKLGLAGRRFVEHRHRWSEVLQPFGDLLRAAAAARAQPILG